MKKHRRLLWLILILCLTTSCTPSKNIIVEISPSISFELPDKFTKGIGFSEWSKSFVSTSSEYIQICVEQMYLFGEKDSKYSDYLELCQTIPFVDVGDDPALSRVDAGYNYSAATIVRLDSSTIKSVDCIAIGGFPLKRVTFVGSEDNKTKYGQTIYFWPTDGYLTFIVVLSDTEEDTAETMTKIIDGWTATAHELKQE